jgi:hypothetical protein
MSHAWRLPGAQALILASIAIGCAPHWPRERVDCGGGTLEYREGYHRVVPRLAPRPSRGEPDHLGAIVMLMTQANARQAGALGGGAMRLYEGQGRAATDVLRRSFMDPNGQAVFDSLPPGWYYLEGLAIGFARLGDSVQVRAGYRDTIELQMRTDDGCLSRVRIGST